MTELTWRRVSQVMIGFGATVGGFLTVASGTPSSELATSSFGGGYKTFVRPRGHFLDDGRNQVNPNYGAVTDYQAPMSARLGMVVDF